MEQFSLRLQGEQEATSNNVCREMELKDYVGAEDFEIYI